MQEKSLRIYSTEKTFFNKVSNTLSKLLIPTKVGINGIIINMKRNNLLKAYDNYNANLRNENEDKKAAYVKKYEDAFTLYLDAIDKNIMDSVYKKVKNGNAEKYEEEALSKYYMITHLKETQYLEYKYRKQKYLLELDKETVMNSGKQKLVEKYQEFYITKQDSLYKGILKNYSIKLADTTNVYDSTKD